MTMPQMPMAMLSFSAGNVARSRPSAAGISSAPNRPWSTRKTMTRVMLSDRPMAPDAAAKPTTPMRKVCRWPKRSPSLPAVIRETARARKYALVIHWTSASVAPRSLAMAGLAMATMVPSRATIMTPTATVNSVNQGCPRSPLPGVASDGLTEGPSPCPALSRVV